MATDLLEKVSAEIDARVGELRPLVAEYERMLAAAEALGLGAGEPGAPAPRSARRARPAAPVKRRTGTVRSGVATKPRRKAPPPRERAPRGAAQQAIIAALEHGSHTVSELTVVTAMSGASIRENLRRLQKAGTITRAKRDDKAAYALAG